MYLKIDRESLTSADFALVLVYAAQVQRITGSDAARCFHGSQMWFEAWCCGTGIASIHKKHCRHHYKTLGKRCPARKRGGEHNPCVASARSAGKSSNPAWDDVWTGYALSRTAALGGPRGCRRDGACPWPHPSEEVVRAQLAAWWHASR